MQSRRMSDQIDFEFEVIPLAKTSDDYYTPKWIFDALGLEFDLDVASPVGGISWIPAKRYFTQYEDGLAQDWSGRVWMNPPYSQTQVWVDKWLKHGNGITLIQISKALWFNKLWETEIQMCLMPSNFKFSKGNGEMAGILMPTVLVALGEENIIALKSSGIGFMR